VLDCLDDAALRRWCASGLAALRRHQREIDELNVYPVPDGDTGTNLVLTMASARQAMETGDGDTLPLMARGALLGARGNSGVILAQLLRGLSETLTGRPSVRGRALAEALGAAAASAYQAVAAPVEGTVLSVASAAAEAARAASSDDLAEVVQAAAGAAADALARTPDQLPVLAAAGVVDAGGRGLVVLLDALAEVVTGVPPAEVVTGPPAGPQTMERVQVRPPLAAARESGSGEYGYEVQYLLDAEPAAVDRLKGELAGLGDSLVVVGDGGTWHVHVHVNDVGAAIEAGVVAGRAHRISVTRFDDQIAEAAGRVDPDRRGAVVVAAGDGLARLLAAEGAAVVGGNPSTSELLAAVSGTGAGRVVVLPNDPNAQAVAAAAAKEAHAQGLRVSVVPTRSPVQALAALAVRDPRRPFEDDVIAMAEAAGACRSAEVCYATREAITMAGRCRAGDVLALVEGEVHLIGADLAQTCRELLDRMLGGGGELVTLLVGADAPAGLADQLREHLGKAWPFMEVQLYDGGQPHYPLLVGVE
jgi:DAK2 domain fusion protein YloV